MGKLRVILVYASVVVIIGVMHLIPTLPSLGTLPLSTSTNPIKVCDRVVPLPRTSTFTYASCPLPTETPEQTTILLLDTNFYSVEQHSDRFFSLFAIRKNKSVVVGMMQDSWPKTYHRNVGL